MPTKLELVQIAPDIRVDEEQNDDLIRVGVKKGLRERQGTGACGSRIAGLVPVSWYIA